MSTTRAMVGGTDADLTGDVGASSAIVASGAIVTTTSVSAVCGALTGIATATSIDLTCCSKGGFNGSSVVTDGSTEDSIGEIARGGDNLN